MNELEVEPEIKECEILPCEFCTLHFTNKIDLNLHCINIHEYDPRDNNISNTTNNILMCKYCNKLYSSRQNRWKHEQKCKNNILPKINTETNNNSLNLKIEELNKLLIEQSKKINELTNFVMNQNNVKNIEI